MKSQRQLLVLDSTFCTNPEDKDHLYKFKFNARIKFNGMIKLEQFIFQNSQYVFSSEKKSDRLIYTKDGNPPMTINIKGMFDNTDSFVKHFNEIMTTNGIRIRMKYTASLYEIQIQHLDGTNFSLEEYYDDGTFMDLISSSCVRRKSFSNTSPPQLGAHESEKIMRGILSGF